MLRIAHRGASQYAPENTMEAFQKALQLGVDAIEFDIQLTKDSEMIVIHDDSIDRTTDGTGLVKNLSLPEIRKFHTPNGELIPTSQEVLTLLKDQCIAKIHIKCGAIEEKVIRLIKENKIENSVIITSEIFSVLRKIRRLSPTIKAEVSGMSFGEKISLEKVIEKAKNIRAHAISPHYTVTTERVVKEAHRNNFEVHVWTVNNQKDIERMKEIGVDGITSDCPDRI